MFFTKTNGYRKMCDTNKNVTKMGVIIKGVYYSSLSLWSCIEGCYNLPLLIVPLLWTND